MPLLALVFCLAVASPRATAAQGFAVQALAAPARSAVENYAAAMQELSASEDRRSLEPLFDKARAAVREIGPHMEGLSSSALSRLRGKLPGIRLMSKDIYAVSLDAKFWAELAERRGDEADRAFLGLLWRTRPDGLRPDYVRPLSEQRGCLEFGSGRLVGLYKDWARYGGRFPKAYREAAAAEEAAVAKDLIDGTCVCGDEDSAAAEYGWFLEAFPKSKLAPRVQSRLKALRGGSSRVRLRCLSG